MRKITLLFIAVFAISFMTKGQLRYINEVYTNADISVTTDVPYGANWNPYLDPAVVGGQTQVQPLMLDVYAPDAAVDTNTQRPVVMIFHSGSFLPPSISGNCTGAKNDSAVVQLCKRYARHGFVAVSATYRLGWLANNTDLDLRRGTNLLAVYYAIQDAKTAVRYLNASALGLGNPHGIDPSKTILLGIGSGGYITFGYSSIDKLSEVANPTKFQYQGSTGILGGTVTPGDPYVDTATFGDWDGFGGAATIIGQNPNGLPIIDTNQPGRNIENHAGLPDDVLMVANMGGALGDSSWLEAGELPMVSVHSKYDFFAPYDEGMVQVPVGQQFFPVVYVNGSHWAVSKANALGNNDIFLNANYTDQLWQIGINNMHNTNQAPGIFTINIEPANASTPWIVNNAPWDFWDANATCSSPGNPNDKANSMAYIDTAFNYLLPRMLTALEDAGMNIGIDDNHFVSQNLDIYPNPASGKLFIESKTTAIKVENVRILDVTGKVVLHEIAGNNSKTSLSLNGISTGMYLLQLETSHGVHIQKLLIK